MLQCVGRVCVGAFSNYSGAGVGVFLCLCCLGVMGTVMSK